MTNGLPALEDPALFWRVTNHSVKLMRREEKPIRDEYGPWATWSGDYERLPEKTKVPYRTWWGARREREETRLVRHRVNIVIREELDRDETTELIIPVTRESIPVLAERALKKYHESIERASLIGDYPPKTWEES